MGIEHSPLQYFSKKHTMYHHRQTYTGINIRSLLPSVLLQVCGMSNNAEGKQAGDILSKYYGDNGLIIHCTFRCTTHDLQN